MTIEDKKIKLERASREYSEKEGLLIYVSKGGMTKNLNGKAHSSDEKEIFCRHLAYHLASSKRGVKDYHDAYSSIKKIESIPELAENEFDTKVPDINYTKYHIFPIKHFSKALLNESKSIGKGTEKHLLFNSENHSMALTIRHKKNNEYVIKFYDPNRTNQHIRILCTELSKLENLAFEDFFFEQEVYNENISISQLNALISFKKAHPKLSHSSAVRKLSLIDKSAHENAYCPEVKAGFFAFVKQRKKGEAPELIIDPTTRPEEQLHFLIKYNLLAQHIKTVKKNVLAEILRGNLSDNDKIDRLLDKSSVKFPSILSALIKGYSETVKAYYDEIMNSKLSDDVKCRFFIDENQSINFAIEQTLKEGNIKTALLYLEVILDASLKENSKVELLKGKKKTIALLGMHAILNNQQETLAHLLENILNSTLSDEKKAELILPKTNQGDPGISLAIEKDNAALVGLYITTILDSNLQAEIKTKLIMAMNPQKKSLMHTAIIMEKNEIISFYIDAILNSKLSDSNKIKIIVGSLLDGSLGICMMLVNKRAIKTTQAYLASILNANSPRIITLFKKEFNQAFLRLKEADQNTLMTLLESSHPGLINQKEKNQTNTSLTEILKPLPAKESAKPNQTASPEKSSYETPKRSSSYAKEPITTYEKQANGKYLKVSIHEKEKPLKTQEKKVIPATKYERQANGDYIKVSASKNKSPPSKLAPPEKKTPATKFKKGSDGKYIKIENTPQENTKEGLAKNGLFKQPPSEENKETKTSNNKASNNLTR